MRVKIKNKILNKMKDFLLQCYFYKSKLFYKNIKNNNIMILISRLYNGGAERVAANLADELGKKYNVILVTVDDKTEEDYKCSAKRIVLSPRKEKVSSYEHMFNQIRELRKIKKENKISRTISFCSKMNYFNVMSKANDEVIVSIRSYLSLSKKEKDYAHMTFKCAKYADKIVVVSKILEKEQIEVFKAKPEKIYVINNFLATDKIKDNLSKKEEMNEVMKKPDGEKIVLNIGRLTYQKGQIHLINAFKKVALEIPKAKLVILGQGDLQEELEKRVKELNLTNSVFIEGFKKNPYIYMKNSDIFVLSSLYEGMSNVLLEALYMNLPIISTDCKAGTREILAPNTDLDYENSTITEEEYGILVPIMNNEEELANAIIKMLNNDDLRKKYSEKSNERAKYFSKQDMMKKWIDVIQK